MADPATLFSRPAQRMMSGLREDEAHARPETVVGGDAFRIDDACNRETEFHVVVADRVPARAHAAALDHGVKSPAQHIRQYLGLFLGQILGEAGNAHGAPWRPSHGEDIRKRVAGSDAPERKRFVDDGRKDIHRLHQGFSLRHGPPGGDAQDPAAANAAPARGDAPEPPERVWQLSRPPLRVP